jgi:hypothetical protein
MKPELMQQYIDFLSDVNYCLYKAEEKPSANIHPAWNLWFTLPVKSKICIGFYSHYRVQQILHTEFLEELSTKYTDKFDTGNPHDVIEALALETGLKLLKEVEETSSKEDIEKARALWFSDYYMILTNYDKSKTLRLDLLRLIGNNNKGEIDFKGGLFHAFKHFTKNGTPISHKSEPTELPVNFITKITEVVFYEEPENIKTLENGNERHEFNFEIEGKKFKMFLYLNKECNVYFLDMLRRHS